MSNRAGHAPRSRVATTLRAHVACERLETRRLCAADLAVDAGWFAALPARAVARRTVAEPAAEWIVQLTPGSAAAVGTPAGAAATLAAGVPGIEVVRGLGGRGQLLVTATPAQAAALGRLGDVATVEPNGTFTVAERLSNDPRLLDGSLWALRNTGVFGGVAGADIDAATAWSTTVGRDDVVVAVIDGGIDMSHPDLAANAWRNPGEVAGNAADDDANGFVNDVSGWNFFGDNGTVYEAGDNDHATLVAGIVAARGDNGVGIVGASWNARIMPLKFIGPGGSGPTSGAIAAVNYATLMRQRGVNLRVINASWGGGPYNAALDAAIRAAGSAGILFVASAGNAGFNDDLSATPNYPAAYTAPSIVSVAATDRRDALWWSSNYGLTRVDLGAPGVDILSTVPGGYGTRSGTSFAAPFVAGTAALALSIDATLSVAALKQAILGGVDPLPALAGKTVSGGRLNAARTLALVAPPVEIITTPVGAESVDTTTRADARQLVVRGGGRTVLAAANRHSGGTVVEAGELVIRHVGALGSGPLDVRAGARVTLDVGSVNWNGGGNAVTLAALVLDPAGRLEVGTGQLRVATGGYDAATVRARLLAGRNGGSWDGAAGVTSAAAGAGTARAVGYRVMPDTAELRLGFAAFGDANLDGQVNSADVSLVNNGGKVGQGSSSGAVWSQGDFNYSGGVLSNDLSLMNNARLYLGGSYLPPPPSVSAAGAATGTDGIPAEAWLAYALGQDAQGPTARKRSAERPG